MVTEFIIFLYQFFRAKISEWQFKNYKNVAAEIEGGIIVNFSSQDTNILDLIYRGKIPAQSEDIINELIVQYNKDADNDKKLEARNSSDLLRWTCFLTNFHEDFFRNLKNSGISLPHCERRTILGNL